MNVYRVGEYAGQFKAPPRDGHLKLGTQARGEDRGWTSRSSPPEDLALPLTESCDYLLPGRRPRTAGVRATNDETPRMAREIPYIHNTTDEPIDDHESATTPNASVRLGCKLMGGNRV